MYLKRFTSVSIVIIAFLYGLTAFAQDKFRVTVDFGKTLSQLVSDGQYGWVAPDINDKLFQISGSGVVQTNLVLVHLNRSASTQEVLDEIGKNNLVPASIEHLLAFGAIFSNEQIRYPIVALGSVARITDGRLIVASLWRKGGQRILRRGWFENDWPSHIRFLAVQK